MFDDDDDKAAVKIILHFMELKLLRLTDLFRRHLKTFWCHSVYGQQDTD